MTRVSNYFFTKIYLLCSLNYLYETKFYTSDPDYTKGLYETDDDHRMDQDLF